MAAHHNPDLLHRPAPDTRPTGDPDKTAGGDAPAFVFGGPRGFFAAAPAGIPVVPGDHASRQDRIDAAMAAAGPDVVLGGALPFDPAQPDHLTVAPGLAYRALPPTRLTIAAPGARVIAEPPPPDYAAIVASALRMIGDEAGREDGLRKIVLARSLSVEASAPIDAEALLGRLASDPAATAYLVALPGAGRVLIGATPELLVQKSGARIASYPLAGSARRQADPVADAAAAAGLARSEKDRREHAMVVDYILDTLAPWCSALTAPRGTGLTSTASMWHLGTRIEGSLRDDTTPSVLLASALHPTPAVCGLPRDRAAAAIAALEPVARGFYAGCVGWSDRRGDGNWYVAIRCAELAGPRARLFAGAGIVAGSDPAAETAETAAKFAALLHALGLPPAQGVSAG